MRKLKLQVQMSVDGFIAGPEDEMDWMTWDWDDKLKKFVAKLTKPVDTILLGRKLAEGFIPHWAANPLEEGAAKINKSKRVVFTKTLKKSVWKNARLAKGDLVEEVQKLKSAKGRDMIAYGGGTFVSALIAAGLIDEFFLFVNPVAIGKGMPIFRELVDKQCFTLVKSQGFACGISVLHYSRVATD